MVRLLDRLKAGSIRSDRVIDITELSDQEFGRIRVTHNRSGVLRLNIRTTGEVVLSAPFNTKENRLRDFIDRSRSGIRRALAEIKSHSHSYSDGDKIGRSHRLRLVTGVRAGATIGRNLVTVTLPADMSDGLKQKQIKQVVAKVLKQEAQRYLPKRLHYLADKHGYTYQRVRLTYAKTRWGSCSSKGTISLNIALMTISEQLSDYVLLHELTHTHHMNHGVDFWRELEAVLPGAKLLDRQLRRYSPYL